MSVTTAGGTYIVFDLGNYYNPYSGMPRNGFQIVTTDSVGGEIDSTYISNLYIEFRVTSFTDFTSISI